MAVTAMLCGMNTFSDRRYFVTLQRDWFKKWISLPHEPPSAQTFSNIFQIIDSESLAQCLSHQIKGGFPELAKQSHRRKW